MVRHRYLSEKMEVATHYESTAQSYDYLRSTSFEGRQVDIWQQQFIYDTLIKNRCHNVLECGCGTGRILHFLARYNFKCFGIDLSSAMLAQFKKKLSAQSNISLKISDIECIDFPDNTFDATYTMHVLMHLPTGFDKAFREMYRVTKKGGIIICDFPNKNSLWTRLSILLNPNKKRTYLFTLHELNSYFSTYNYTITGLFSYARTFYKLPLLRHIIVLLERYLPLPLSFRTQLIVIVKK